MGRLEDELSFYRRYHYDKTNVLIHVFCIPLILLSSTWQLARLRAPETVLQALDVPREYWVYANAAGPLSISYGLFYARLDKRIGIPCFIALVLVWLKFSTMTAESTSDAHRNAWIVWAGGWIAQFLGHGVFEHRAPALLDNLQQALVLAPFFAIFEAAYFFGFRKDVIDNIDRKILPEIKEFHRTRGQKA